MPAKDYRRVLKVIFEAAGDDGLNQQQVARAVGVDPSIFRDWKNILDAEGNQSWTPTRKTRNSIDSLLHDEEDLRSDGIEYAVSRMGRVLNELEETLRVRRELRKRLRSHGFSRADEDVQRLNQAAEEALEYGDGGETLRTQEP